MKQSSRLTLLLCSLFLAAGSCQATDANQGDSSEEVSELTLQDVARVAYKPCKVLAALYLGYIYFASIKPAISAEFADEKGKKTHKQLYVEKLLDIAGTIFIWDAIKGRVKWAQDKLDTTILYILGQEQEEKKSCA